MALSKSCRFCSPSSIKIEVVIVVGIPHVDVLGGNIAESLRPTEVILHLSWWPSGFIDGLEVAR
jgi:hypothetical protein